MQISNVQLYMHRYSPKSLWKTNFLFYAKYCVLGFIESDKPFKSFLFNYIAVEVQSKLVQLWLTTFSTVSKLWICAQLAAIWRLMKPVSISCSQVLPFLHYGSMQSQLCLWGQNHWAIHHRWQGTLWNLAAILPLGIDCLNRAKMASGKPCDALRLFLHLSLFNPMSIMQ